MLSGESNMPRDEPAPNVSSIVAASSSSTRREDVEFQSELFTMQEGDVWDVDEN